MQLDSFLAPIQISANYDFDEIIMHIIAIANTHFITIYNNNI